MGNLGEVGFSNLFKTLGRGIAEHRFLAWMENPEEEELMTLLGCSGALKDDPAEPELGVYFADETWSKISWYFSSNTHVDEGVKNSDGTTSYRVTTTMTNNLTLAEAANQVDYITGYHPNKKNRAGMFMHVYLVAPAGGSISNISTEGGDFSTSAFHRNAVQPVDFLHREPRSSAGGETITISYDVTVSAEAETEPSWSSAPLLRRKLLPVGEPTRLTPWQPLRGRRSSTVIRVDIESIIMAAGPVPSVVVLRERKGGAGVGRAAARAVHPDGSVRGSRHWRRHGLRQGHAEAHRARRAAATRCRELGAKVERVEINRWEAPVFYADVVLDRGGDEGCRGEDGTDGEGRDGDTAETRSREIKIDARPSDALALASALERPHLRRGRGHEPRREQLASDPDTRPGLRRRRSSSASTSSFRACPPTTSKYQSGTGTK